MTTKEISLTMLDDMFMRRAKVVRVIDGDTYELRIDLGYRVEGRFLIRLRGFDAAELRDAEGPAMRLRAESLLLNAREILVKSYKDHQTFARWVADVYVDRFSLADLLKEDLRTMRDSVV